MLRILATTCVLWVRREGEGEGRAGKQQGKWGCGWGFALAVLSNASWSSS